ncbi:tRNA-U20-dihydrouridine synthase [Limnobacter thiooxidans]|uniref:tRNA dihydrouridine synthase DusB n=1 Tax=Limnobacter TaxID=131079 RepID=UPI0010E7C878|nr:tRNA dihydrouridine synthase DusB [Limnobacter sp.]MCZ8016782.1 tRNA dihydrouridine synthase DusB [Limnobacter sp.]RZS38338.1 tRNA-U20-dihydrouridine synthase [Limnobacter thiooxidans]
MQIAHLTLPNNLFLAPMAGVTDRPFRQLCKKLGAGHAVSEMAASNPALWKTDKSTRRLNHYGETKPIAVQIAGSDPDMMAHAAAYNIERGAQIIDVNMGCPAKKVCAVAAGSALLQNEPLVESILKAVHAECAKRDVPLTLKYRTGWSPEHKNAIHIAQMAESIGVSLLTLHGRTRACGYTGDAEYDTIRAVKQAVSIPVIANGDITTPEKAKFVLDYTGADGLMIGRAAQGNPWIFREVLHYLKTGEALEAPTLEEAHEVMMHHLRDHHEFYGEKTGLLTARKHLQWYLCGPAGKNNAVVDQLMLAQTTDAQLRIVDDFFRAWKQSGQQYFAAENDSIQHTPKRRLAA